MPLLKERISQKGAGGTDELLYIDQHIIKEVKIRRSRQGGKVAMTWFDKENDILPQTWITEYLEMYKISEKVKNLIMKVMEKWEVEFAAGVQTFVEV